MALPPRLDEFREVYAVTTGEDATSGDKVLVDPNDVPADKILTVRAFHYNSDAGQDFELKTSGGVVLAHFHLPGQGNSSDNAGGLGVFACPAGEGLTVEFINAAANSLFAAAIELVNVP